MSPEEMKLDMLVAELDYENRLLRARNERLEREAEQRSQQNPVPVTDNTYGYAKSLAEAIFKQHFASDEHYASGRVVWGVFDTVEGILTQIDNMVADMVRRPAQQEPDYKALYEKAVQQYNELADLMAEKKEQQEPFGHVTVRRLSLRFENHADQYHFYPAGQSPYLDNVDELHAVYTRPQAREWLGLTDNEVLDMARTFGAQPWPPGSCVALGQMIEAKLREKNQ